MNPTNEELTREIAHLESQQKTNSEEAEAIREMKGDVSTLVDKLTRTQAAGQIISRRLSKARETLRNRKTKAIDAKAAAVRNEIAKAEAKKAKAKEEARQILTDLYGKQIANMVQRPGERVPTLADSNSTWRESAPERAAQATINGLEDDLKKVEAERRAAQ